MIKFRIILLITITNSLSLEYATSWAVELNPNQHQEKIQEIIQTINNLLKQSNESKSSKIHYNSNYKDTINHDKITFTKNKNDQKFIKLNTFQYLNKTIYNTHLFENLYLIHFNKNFTSNKHPNRVPKHDNNFLHHYLKFHPHIYGVKTLHNLKSRKPRGFLNLNFKDPFFTKQWHLLNTGQPIFQMPQLDMDITPVWQAGITGKNVVVTIVDDGVDYKHLDLFNNYEPLGSFDLNDGDDDPFPKIKFDQDVDPPRLMNTHGTRCAGEIAAIANNSICGVGVAYNAKFSAIRILDGVITDAEEAIAFSKNLNINQIFSCSWGPDDDGKTVDGPHALAKRALVYGTTNGRHGLGSIYVVASGNGGKFKDNCNFDGYANSIYTLTIGVVDYLGRFPKYAEICSSMISSTFSGGDSYKNMLSRYITTTDWDGTNEANQKCTFTHSGTSAATPLAAGSLALALEANPCLSWREVQWIIILTSRPEKADQTYSGGFDFAKNNAGLLHSHHYGFGVLDVKRLVAAASQWSQILGEFDKNGNKIDFVNGLGLLKSFKKEFNFGEEKLFKNSKLFTISISEGDLNSSLHISILEQVVLTFSLNTKIRGKIAITLTCPESKNGISTKSKVVTARDEDDSDQGFVDWSVSTVRCFGEKPVGDYKIFVESADEEFTMEKLELGIYGNSMGRVEFERIRDFARNVENIEKNNITFDKCIKTRYKNYPNPTFLLQGKTLRILKIIAALSFIWTIYCIIDCGFLDSDEKENYKKSLEQCYDSSNMMEGDSAPSLNLNETNLTEMTVLES